MQRRISILVLFALLLVGSVVAAEELHTALILTTPSVQCGLWHPASWTNPGGPLRIRSTSIIVGAPGFYEAEVMRESDGAPVHYFTTGAGNAFQAFDSHWMTLGAGETLYLWTYCAPPGEGRLAVFLGYTQ